MNPMPKTLREKASQIKLLILDVDGVLTDGTLVYSATGEEVKHFNAKDGLGIRLLADNNVEIAIITARKSKALERRMKDLQVKHFYSGQHNKLAAFDKLLNKLNLHSKQVAYVGDDILDLPVMKKVGFPITVADGHCIVKDTALWITTAFGGKGAVREIADGLIASKTNLKQSCEDYLNKQMINNKHMQQ